jgi:lipopolysaccharide transport system ATP-binding protein
MAKIIASNVCVDFPIYGIRSRSLKTSVLKSTVGGNLGNSLDDKVVVKALKNLSFELNDGDRVGLIGHNGSGKSTLLRVMAGLYEPTSGSILIKGKVTSMLNIFLGMDPEASGLENIRLRSMIMGIGPQKIKSKIDEIVDFSGLGNFVDLPMRTYSSGMAMRLAFAVATGFDAEIILMDEWLSAGDAEFVDTAKKRLDSLVSKANIVVIASHDMNLINLQCHKIFRMEHGCFS